MRLIDANELLERMKTIENFSNQKGMFAIVQKMIENAPTVKTTNNGRWIKVEDDYNNHLYECSNCHTWTSLPTEEVNNGNIKYCWSCGAKMDGIKT